jgi:diguanylate cyclase (GGDEF)-like protein
MRNTTTKPSIQHNSHTYFIYVSLSFLLTQLLHLFHSYLIGSSFKPVALIMPGVAGVFFGYLLARNHILHKHLNKCASIDVLTGTYNRMQCNYFLTAEIDKVNRYNGTFSIIYIDLDHFKDINDQYGHPVGDAILTRFSEIISSLNRTSDIFSRYGGEEFLIIAHETNANKAVQHAERLRVEIEQYPFETIGRLTCSFGVTEFIKDKDTIKTILKRADDALYKAKKNGRNRVVEF